jgi:O-acetyl-ADP-ribose deacetylase (regulator of RNase III)
MIYEVTGDITKTKAKAIAHGIAPNDDFKKGLAMNLRETWPSLYKDFRHYCHTKHPEAGSLWTWGAEGGMRIFNLLTQEGSYEAGVMPGKASIHNVHSCLKSLKKAIAEEKVSSLALPLIATGMGGLKPAEVLPLIKEEFKDSKIPIYLYTEYRQGVAANEP